MATVLVNALFKQSLSNMVQGMVDSIVKKEKESAEKIIDEAIKQMRFNIQKGIGEACEEIRLRLEEVHGSQTYRPEINIVIVDNGKEND